MWVDEEEVNITHYLDLGGILLDRKSFVPFIWETCFCTIAEECRSEHAGESRKGVTGRGVTKGVSRKGCHKRGVTKGGHDRGDAKGVSRKG